MLFLELDAKEFMFYFPQLHPPRFANSLQYSQNINVNEQRMVTRYIFDFMSVTHTGVEWGGVSVRPACTIYLLGLKQYEWGDIMVCLHKHRPVIFWTVFQ